MSFLVDYGESSDSEGEEGGKQLTDPGKSRDIRNILSVLPAPRKGKKEPVRIGFPSRDALGVRGRGVEGRGGAERVVTGNRM